MSADLLSLDEMTATTAHKLREDACAARVRLVNAKGRSRSAAYAAWMAAEERAFWACRSASIDKATKEGTR